MTERNSYEYSENTMKAFKEVSYKSGIESMICERLGLDYYNVHVNRPYAGAVRENLHNTVYVKILGWTTEYKEVDLYHTNKYLFVDIVVMEYLFR
jgi:hypothetical protein